MANQSETNKTAWEHRAYEYWQSQGTPQKKADHIKKDPRARLRYHQKYFQNIQGKKIANPCGSNGRIAVPLALLGANVTVFDISEENRRYALELAACAGISIGYEVGDFTSLPTGQYAGYFDIAYLEGGILHYFSSLAALAQTLQRILKPGGQLVLSDFHPFRKINPTGSAMMSVPQTEGDYFDARLHNAPVAYQGAFDEAEQQDFPQCLLRFYTLADIITAVAEAGFVIKEFTEHPNFENPKLPGEFTVFAVKSA